MKASIKRPGLRRKNSLTSTSGLTSSTQSPSTYEVNGNLSDTAVMIEHPLPPLEVLYGAMSGSDMAGAWKAFFGGKMESDQLFEGIIGAAVYQMVFSRSTEEIVLGVGIAKDVWESPTALFERYKAMAP